MTTEVEALRGVRAIDVLREQIAPKASDTELAYLAQVSQRLGLDPIAGHIVLIPRYDKRVGREVHRPQITADGRLVLADRTGALDGFDGPEWTGPRNTDGTHTWRDVWDASDEREKPYAARVIVYRRDRARPTNGTVRWLEFAQVDSNGNLLPMWRQMPSHMLGKVALSLGLRRAFPGVIPTDVDLDDDFVGVEEGRGGVAAPTADRDAGDPPDNGSDPDEPPGRPVSAIEQRAAALDEHRARLFADWIERSNLPWPPDRPAVVTICERKLAELEGQP